MISSADLEFAIQSDSNQLIAKDEDVNVYKLLWHQQVTAVVVVRQDCATKVSKLNTVFAKEHPSIIRKLQEVFSNGMFYFLTEYGLQLSDLLHSPVNGKFINYSVGNILLWCRQIADGLAYLHSLDILHNNLTTAAIIISKDFSFAQVAYFGLSQSDDAELQLESFQAHEMVTKSGFKIDAPRGYQTNVYQMGVVFWEMIYRKVFSAQQANSSDSDTIFSALRLLYKSCLANSARRPTARTVAKLSLVLCKRYSRVGSSLTDAMNDVQLCDTGEMPHCCEQFESLWAKWEINNLARQVTSGLIIDLDDIRLFLTNKRYTVIGAGGFGNVCRLTIDEQAIAIKVIRDTWDSDSQFRREIESFTKIAEQETIHANIVGFLGAGSLFQDYFIVLEYALCSLYEVLFGTFNGSQFQYSVGTGLLWCRDVASAVAYLHNFLPAIVHRDLKPNNILLFNEYQVAKITDFGLARYVEQNMTRAVGTVRYMAAEVINGEEYDTRCDVYSCGAVFFEIFSRQKFTHRAVRVDNISFRLRIIYEACVRMNPLDRPTMGLLLMWIKSVVIEAFAPKGLQNTASKDPSDSCYPFLPSDPYFVLWKEWDYIGLGKNCEISNVVSHAVGPQNRVFIFGGWESGVLSSVCSFSSIEETWRDEPFTIPRSRFEGTAVVLSNGHRILLTGGRNQYRLLAMSDVIELDASTMTPTFATIENCPVLSRACCDAVTVDCNTKVLIAGGQEDFLKSAEMFVESIGYSIYLPDLLEDRCQLALAVDYTRQPNQLIATGGWPSQQTTEGFDLAEMRWNIGPALSNARSCHAAASLGNRMFVTGGRSSSKSMEMVDGRESRWQPVTDMIHRRWWHRMLAVDDHRLLAVGGFRASSVEMFDERNLQWRECAPLRNPRHSFQAVVF